MIKAVVKHSYLKGSKGAGKAGAHINYIQYRAGEDRDKEPREFFNSEREDIEGREVKERLLEQERNGVAMHKIILSPGVPGSDMHNYTREMMERLEREKGQRLDWYAVEHQNTEHPHAHVVVMGKDLDGGRVRIHLDSLKDLRGWGDRYLEREHLLERYLDRELDRLIQDKWRGKEVEYERSKGDRMYERLMYGDPEQDRKRTARDAERDRREWEQLDKDLHKTFDRERGLEHKLTYRQYQMESKGRLIDFHADYTGQQFRERWEELAERDPDQALRAKGELAWLDRIQAEDRADRTRTVDIDRLVDGLEPWQRDNLALIDRIQRSDQREWKEREQLERGHERPNQDREHKEIKMPWERQEPEQGRSRAWETFESDRQGKSQEPERDDDERERDRDRGDDMFGR